MADNIVTAVIWIGSAPITDLQRLTVLDAERAIKALQEYVALQKTPNNEPPPLSPCQKFVESLRKKLEEIVAFLDAPAEAIQYKPLANEDPRVQHSIAIEGRDNPSLTSSFLKYLGEDSLRRDFELARGGRPIGEEELEIPKRESLVKRYVKNTSTFIDKAAATRAINNGIKVRVFELISERKLFQGEPSAMRSAYASALGMIISFAPRKYRGLLEGQIEALVDAIGICPEIEGLARKKYLWRAECSSIYGYSHNLVYAPSASSLAFRNNGPIRYPSFLSQEINPDAISISEADYWMHFSHTHQIIEVPDMDYAGMFS